MVRSQGSWSRVSNSILQDGPQFKGLEKRMEEALLSGYWLIVLSFYIPNLNIYPYIFILNEYKIFLNLVWHFPSANISALIQHSPNFSPLILSIEQLIDRTLRILVILLLTKL